jgi:hypothetical protein
MSESRVANIGEKELEFLGDCRLLRVSVDGTATGTTRVALESRDAGDDGAITVSF